MISAAEREEFRLVVHHAKLEGWLAKADQMRASEGEASVLVECTGPDTVRKKSYPHDARWPYELLRDLAHGFWRVAQQSAGLAEHAKA